jgi:hypothetical protein
MESSQATSRSQASFPKAIAGNTVIITINRAHRYLPKPFCWSLLRSSPRTVHSGASVKDSRRRKLFPASYLAI